MKPGELSARKKLAFTVILVALVWVTTDTVVYFFLDQLQQRMNLFVETKVPSDKELQGFWEKHWHRDWGWDLAAADRGPLGNRESRTYGDRELFMIKVYGDSFTYGSEVGANETYASEIEKKMGWECLNFGTEAYGSDQAFLKYRDSSVRSKYSVLAILDENIGRVMTVWWNFYDPRGPFGGTKPRFDLTSDKVMFVDNPTKSYEDLKKLQSAEYIRSLELRDYWVSYYESANVPRALHWPATRTLLPHINHFFMNGLAFALNNVSPNYWSLTASRKFYHLYAEDSVGLKTLKHVVGLFKQTAEARGEIPIVMIFPLLYTMELIDQFDKKPYQSLVNYLMSNGIAYIDFGEVFRGEEYQRYYISGHKGWDPHFSPEGHARVAEELIGLIQTHEHVSIARRGNP